MQRSYSIYRGQSERGHGEGPDRPVNFGEQYLAYSPGFPWNNDFLGAIRPWMKMSAPSRLHQELAGGLTGWSLFEESGYLIVARISSVLKYSSYDNRPAYFAHGRAYRTQGLGGWMDPGLLLGDLVAFDDPWNPEAWPESGQWPVSGEPDLDGAGLDALSSRVQATLAEHRVVGISLLGHLFHARMEGLPLVIAVPSQEFHANSRLPRLLSFARAALPTSLKATCTIRIYDEDDPRQWLTKHGVAVLVIDESNASKAIEARPDAFVLDRRGQVVRSGRTKLSSEVKRYSEKTVDLVTGSPGGLLPFSRRIDFLLGKTGGALTPAIVASQATAYYLAFSSRKPETFRDLLQHYLLRKVEEVAPLPWNHLMPPRPDAFDWEQIPDEDLSWLIFCEDFPLTAPDQPFDWQARAGLRELAIVELAHRVWEHRSGRPDETVSRWWDSGEPSVARLAHLIYLADRGVLSATAVAALAARFPLHTLASRPHLAYRALALEEPSGAAGQPERPIIAGWGSDAAGLAHLLLSHPAPAEFQRLLVTASAEATLHPGWAAHVIDSQGSRSWSLILLLIEDWMTVQRRIAERPSIRTRANQLPAPPGAPSWSAAWDAVLESSLKALAAPTSELPEALVGPIERLAEILDPATDSLSCLLACRILVRMKPDRATYVLQSFWGKTTELSASERRHLVEQAFATIDSAYLLFVDDPRAGRFMVPEDVLRDVGPILAGQEDLLKHLAPGALMQLYHHSREQGAPARLFQRADAILCDRRDRTSQREMLSALVDQDAYALWRRGTPEIPGSWPGTLTQDGRLLADLAIAWLTHERWRDPQGGRPTIDAWNVAAADLAPRPGVTGDQDQDWPGFDETTVEQLVHPENSPGGHSGGARWPIIQHHDWDQYQDLCGACSNLVALVVLMDHSGYARSSLTETERAGLLDATLNAATGLPADVRQMIAPHHLAVISKEVVDPRDEELRDGEEKAIALLFQQAGSREERVREYASRYMDSFLSQRMDVYTKPYAYLGSFMEVWDSSRLGVMLRSLADFPGPPDWKSWILGRIDDAQGTLRVSVSFPDDDSQRSSAYRRAGYGNLAMLFRPSPASGAGTPALAGPDSQSNVRSPVWLHSQRMNPPVVKRAEDLMTRGRPSDEFLVDLCNGKRIRHHKNIIDDARQYHDRRDRLNSGHPLQEIVDLGRSWVRDNLELTQRQPIWPTFMDFLKKKSDAFLLAGHTAPEPDHLPILELFLVVSRDSMVEWFADINTIPDLETHLCNASWWRALRSSLANADEYRPGCDERYFENILQGMAAHPKDRAPPPFGNRKVRKAFAAAFGR